MKPEEPQNNKETKKLKGEKKGKRKAEDDMVNIMKDQYNDYKDVLQNQHQD